MARIIVDAFGGDNAPLEVIKGCERAVKELGVQIVLLNIPVDYIVLLARHQSIADIHR